MLGDIDMLPAPSKEGDLSHAQPPGLDPVLTSFACGVAGSLILDDDAIIRFCSSELAALAGFAPGELVGQAVKILLPGLPIRSGTRGYNIAYASFWFAAGGLHPLMLVKADGGQVKVEAAIAAFKAENDYFFCLGVHPVSWPACEAQKQAFGRLRRPSCLNVPDSGARVDALQET